MYNQVLNHYQVVCIRRLTRSQRIIHLSTTTAPYCHVPHAVVSAVLEALLTIRPTFKGPRSKFVEGRRYMKGTLAPGRTNNGVGTYR